MELSCGTREVSFLKELKKVMVLQIIGSHSLCSDMDAPCSLCSPTVIAFVMFNGKTSIKFCFLRHPQIDFHLICVLLEWRAGADKFWTKIKIHAVCVAPDSKERKCLSVSYFLRKRS